MFLRFVAYLVMAAVLVASPALGEEPAPSGKGNWKALFAQKTKRQHAIIKDFFGGRRGGIFVDVGAADYREGNMTFFLEKDFGWSGIAIDALEHWGAGYAEHRPRTRFFTYIVTDHAGAEEPFYRMKSQTGSTAVKGRAKMLKDLGADITEVLVPTITLNKLLDRESITKIDFLSMDIEHGEPAALAGFDIERFRPELVGTEAAPANYEALMTYFEEHGYRRIDEYLERHEGDWYFTCKVKAACAPKADAGEPTSTGQRSSSTEK